MGADAAPAKKSHFRLIMGGFLGLCTGAGTMYFNAIFNSVVRPPKPVANFKADADGLTLTCQNMATGQSGWWDFGDGSPLEPFDPDAKTVTHQFPKPGTYSVKLMVQNFLLDENDRTVSVEASAASATAAAPNALPKLVGVQVEKLNDQVPATCRVTADVQNADEIVWAAGDQRVHSPVQAGKFEQYVRIDKAGQVPIVLTALSKSHATPDVQVFPVNVANPRTAVFDVRLDVTDAAAKTQTATRTETLPCAVKDGHGKPTAGFTRQIAARPGGTIKAAAFDPKGSRQANLVKNVKCEVAADGRAVTVTGEWAQAADATEKAAGGSTVFVPVSLTEERASASAPSRNQHSFTLTPVADRLWQGSLRLTPKPADAARTVALVIGLTQPDGSRTELARTTLTGTAGEWSAPLTGAVAGMNAKAAVVNGEVQVAVGNLGATPRPAAPLAAPAAGKKK
jgi:hypothetical protein